MFCTSSPASIRCARHVRRTLSVLLLNACLCFAAGVSAAAQDIAPPSAAPAPDRAPRRLRRAARRALLDSERNLERAPESRRPRARLLARVLDLTNEQRRQLDEIRRRNRIERRALVARLRRAERELDDQIYADAIDTNEIDARVRRVADLQNELIALRAKIELDVRRVLTAEQLSRLRTLRAEARAPRRRRPPLDASRRQRSS